MPKPFLFFLLFLLTHGDGYAQLSDIIAVQKKNGRRVASFSAGSRIQLRLNNGMALEGPIRRLKNDSIYITLYDIRRMPDRFGGATIDTIGVSLMGLPVSAIGSIYVRPRRRLQSATPTALLKIGGAGYAGLTAINAILHGESLGDKSNLRAIGIGAGMFAAGWALDKLTSRDGYSTKRHRIVYLKVE